MSYLCASSFEQAQMRMAVNQEFVADEEALSVEVRCDGWVRTCHVNESIRTTGRTRWSTRRPRDYL